MQALNEGEYYKHRELKHMATAVRFGTHMQEKDWRKFLKSKG